ncbi:MAG: hypothetical protein IJJ06_09150 [Mogibacterium sp.]|nr:hypothetical protein [Mogibacterium sp.]MBR0342482.1 hypothetical protein [Oscillospiraceae bacterium]
MTVMLLAGESIGYEGVNDNYDGTYLMFDNQHSFQNIGERRSVCWPYRDPDRYPGY